jgi:hypothetical protein
MPDMKKLLFITEFSHGLQIHKNDAISVDITDRKLLSNGYLNNRIYLGGHIVTKPAPVPSVTAPNICNVTLACKWPSTHRQCSA